MRDEGSGEEVVYKFINNGGRFIAILLPFNQNMKNQRLKIPQFSKTRYVIAHAETLMGEVRVKPKSLFNAGRIAMDPEQDTQAKPSPEIPFSHPNPHH